MSVKQDAFENVLNCFANLNAMFDDIKSRGNKDGDVEIDGAIDTYRKELKTISDFVDDTKEVVKMLNDNIQRLVIDANDSERKANQYYGWWKSEDDKNDKLTRKLKAIRETLDLMID